MKCINIIVAANVSYSGMTTNTKLLIQYKHTGKIYSTKNKTTYDVSIAENWKNKGNKVKESEGYYFIDRLAIPAITANGKNDYWYINNDGDGYSINKVSKYGKKIHTMLSNNDTSFLPNPII